MSEAPLRPLVIPIFLPGQGCPHRCVYCDQAGIAGRRTALPSPGEVGRAVARALEKSRVPPRGPVEVAFYGGTFTGLPRQVAERLLGEVQPFLQEGRVDAIRVSTRPDALDEERVRFLQTLGVRTVEVGAHSMDDEVLSRSRRGHNARQIRDALKCLKRHGLDTVVQLMPGLPGESESSWNRTVGEMARLGPSMARIYPVLVLKGTLLAQWMRKEAYRPLDLEEAVLRCAAACATLESAGVRVIRMGLLPSDSLLRRHGILAGPWHPSFGFLVRAQLYREQLLRRLPADCEGRDLMIRVPRREVPLARGYRNEGLRSVAEITGAAQVQVVPDPRLRAGEMEVVRA